MFRLCLTCLLLTAVGALLAQAPTGTIAGTVTDQSGAVVPNAKITIVNKDTGSTREMLAGTDGTFSSRGLAGRQLRRARRGCRISPVSSAGHCRDRYDHHG